MSKKTIIAIVLFFCAAAPDSTSSSESDESTTKIKYSYTLWVGDDVDEIHKLNLKSEKGIVFYDAMVQAAAIDSNYVFATTVYPPYGRFVDQIGAYHSTSNHFWRFYILPQPPNKNHRPDKSFLSPLGIDSLVVEDKKHYLWWFKTVVPGTHD